MSTNSPTFSDELWEASEGIRLCNRQMQRLAGEVG